MLTSGVRTKVQYESFVHHTCGTWKPSPSTAIKTTKLLMEKDKVVELPMGSIKELDCQNILLAFSDLSFHSKVRKQVAHSFNLTLHSFPSDE